MYILMISRGVPSKYHPQWGCFEKDQAEALAAYGHKVVVLSVDARLERHRGRIGTHKSSCNGVEYYNYIMIPGVFIYKLIGKNRYRQTVMFYYADKLYKKIISIHGKPDIIFSQFYFNTITGVQLKQKYNIPLVGIEHYSKFNNPNLSKTIKIGASIAFQGVDKLICVCKSLADNIEKRFGVKSVVVHNMYGHEFDGCAGHNFNTNINNPLLFVSTASLIYGKGFDVLINAFANSTIPKDLWRLHIIGDGEERENLERLIVNCNLQDNVFLLGKKEKSEIVKELSNNHVFVLPSRGENFSVAILEALAMGLPVIATDCGGIHECLEERNGIIVPVDDIDAMTDAIKRMADTYSQYDRKCIADDCKRRFSPMAIAEKLTTVFEETVKHTH